MEPNSHPTPTIPHRLLQDWALAMVVFGLAIVLVPWVRDDLFGWIAVGDTGYVDSFGDEARDYLRLNQAIMGAVTAGLGLAGFWLARVPIVRGERWAWNALATSIGLWFVVDVAGSVAAGYPRNVGFNVILVLPLLPLLWLTHPGRSEARRATSRGRRSTVRT